MEVTILIVICLILIIFILLGKIKSLSEKNEKKAKQLQAYDFSAVTASRSFETILKSITDGLVIIDPKGSIMLANQSFKEILRISEPVEGRQVIEVVRNLDLIELIRESFIKKEEVAKEITVKKSGQDIYIFAKAMPILNNQGVIYFLIILLHDITRLKQLENIRRDFVANVSHELKTPITAIKGYAETLLEGALEDKENAFKFIEIIKNQAERLSSLVEDLLTLSRIESGSIVVKKRAVSVEELVKNSFNILEEKAKKKGLQLNKEIPSNATIYADRDKFLQILINLVDNAIKFTEKGAVTVKFYRENKSFVVSVEDTGIGIPPEHIPRIGERFYRVDRARSRQLGGTGLGLAIVKHLVLAHGWQFKIESKVGIGTKVKLIIPSED